MDADKTRLLDRLASLAGDFQVEDDGFADTLVHLGQAHVDFLFFFQKRNHVKDNNLQPLNTSGRKDHDMLHVRSIVLIRFRFSESVFFWVVFFNDQVRIAAIQNLNKQESLIHIFTTAASDEVRHAALHKISDKRALLNIAARPSRLSLTIRNDEIISILDLTLERRSGSRISG